MWQNIASLQLKRIGLLKHDIAVMQGSPTVTWLLPVRNGMPYLPLTLESIAEQSYQNHKIIAWDNGSHDGTVEELCRWIPGRIPGVVVAGRPMRLGPSLAAMVEMADTELCARMDGDDINAPDRLERQVAFMLEHPNVGILGSQLDLIDEENRKLPSADWSYSIDDASIRWLLRWRNQLAHNAVMYRRSVILAAGNYRDTQPFEDLDLWQRASCLTEMWNLPEVLVHYRRITSTSTGAIKNFLPTDRAAAKLNASILFPGLQRTSRVMSLWEATHPYQLHLPSKYRHIRELEQAALLLAQKVGKPSNYFTETETYKEQRFRLRRRFFKRMKLMPLIRLRDHLRIPQARDEGEVPSRLT
jgi:glycosyltransferase involved in cell wall biosynthesis